MVVVKARMRVSAEWIDVTIGNVSSRGLMAKCAEPPAKGSYVEIRQRGCCIIGRVAWSHGLRFGIRTQDRIDLATLLAEPTIKRVRAQRERHIEPRRPAPARVVPGLEVQLDRSRRLSRAVEWAAIVGFSVFAVIQLAAGVGNILGQPLTSVGSALAGG